MLIDLIQKLHLNMRMNLDRNSLEKNQSLASISTRPSQTDNQTDNQTDKSEANKTDKSQQDVYQNDNLFVQILRGDKCESLHKVAYVLTGPGLQDPAVKSQLANCQTSKNSVDHDQSPGLQNEEQKYEVQEYFVFPRSAIKMIQAFLLAKYCPQISLDRLALACSSHMGEKIHTELAAKWLQDLKLQPDNLVCAAHEPYDEATRKEMIRSGTAPQRLHNNCSGKHSGFLQVCLTRGWNLNYEQWQHPLQYELRQLMTELTGEDFASAPWGVDGCGIPTYYCRLSSVAKMWSQFLLVSLSADMPSLNSTTNSSFNSPLNHSFIKTLNCIVQAVQTYPLLIGGQQSLCSRLLLDFPTVLMIKTGAEGVYAGVLWRSQVAFAVKVIDGASRAAEAAVLHLIQQHGQLTSSESELLNTKYHKQILNWAGKAVGDITVSFQSC